LLVSSESPWPGLASFTEEQRAYFHGRDEEILDLTQLAERRPLVVLFGQSGLGKSSLLQAGVFPLLRADGFCPVYVRLDHSEGAPSPTEQIKELVRTETAKIGTWTKPGIAQPGESLWEFFHHRGDRLIDRDSLGVVPVLVFDQFEELFTLGAAKGERAQGTGRLARTRRDRSIYPNSGIAGAGRARVAAAIRIFPNAAAATEGANWLSSFPFLAERTRNKNDWRRT
jgi:hypothetical protein